MMRPRPQMFLGQRSLTTLSGFIGGYFETEKLLMEEVNREFQVSLDEWETLNTI
ncbi:hypothetical protein [Nostoc sp.]|uniref:hypothetical protein n=1 Tax=Nostoc sp. TaxID=1180 RepID=UPI002FFB7F4E